MTHQINKLVVITRGDMTPGYQMAQSCHSVSQFILEHHDLAKKWNNNFLISLSIDSEEKLSNLLTKIQDIGVPVSYFTEPDIDNQLTSICFLETEQTRRLTSSLPLSLKNFNKQ